MDSIAWSRRAWLAAVAAPTLRGAGTPPMLWGDTSRLGRPFSKDPSAVFWRGRTLLYYSLPPFGDGRANDGWAIGIAQSRNLRDWTPVGEVLPAGEYESKGLCAPNVIALGGRIHMFYQTYGNRERDAICHAVSDDGVTFRRNRSNPIFRPTGDWNCGRAIDAEIVAHGGKLLLYGATRDPGFRVQMLFGAAAPLDSDFGRDAWTQFAGGPLLAPELSWEKRCIEAPAVFRRDGKLYMFYAGGYNNEPQQIGCAVSEDGVRYRRLFEQPFLANGAPGEWNASESGHPGAYTAPDGRCYLFYQGNADKGRTWRLSWVEIGWRDGMPYVKV